MMRIHPKFFLILSFFLFFHLVGVQVSFGKGKVLVVMSYSDTDPGELEMQAGIEKVLHDVELRYAYLDTIKHPGKGAQKSQEAYELYKQYQPDVIITVGDNAQSMFVLPYIKDKIKTPVVFCGVNDDAAKYGYPTAQITGVLEKKYYKQSIQFARLIVPSIFTIAVIYKPTRSNAVNVGQIEKERSGYGIKITGLIPVTTIAELQSAFERLAEKVDGLLVLNLAGIDDEEGNKMGQKEAFQYVVTHWNKPTVGASDSEIRAGLLCAVAQRKRDQGRDAAAMVKKILSGTPASKLPVIANKNGQRAINVTTAQKLDLRLKPMVLIGTELFQ